MRKFLLIISYGEKIRYNHKKGRKYYNYKIALHLEKLFLKINLATDDWPAGGGQWWISTGALDVKWASLGPNGIQAGPKVMAHWA